NTGPSRTLPERQRVSREVSQQGGDLSLLSLWSSNMSGRDDRKTSRPRIMARHRDCNHIVSGQPVFVDIHEPAGPAHAAITIQHGISGNRSLSTRRQLSASSTFLMVSAIASSVAARASGAMGSAARWRAVK